MIGFLLAPENLPYTIAIAVVFFMGILEGVFMMIGAGLSDLLESVLNVEAPETGVDAGDSVSGSPLSRLLGWLRIGEVPALIVLVVLLTTFGLAGLCVQFIAKNSLGFLLPAWGLAPVTALAALPFTRGINSILCMVLPRDETQAVSEKEFVGMVAVITRGTAKRGRPAEARLVDRFGNSHYVLIEPDDENESLAEGTDVLLVKEFGAGFTAIINTNPHLKNP